MIASRQVMRASSETSSQVSRSTAPYSPMSSRRRADAAPSATSVAGQVMSPDTSRTSAATSSGQERLRCHHRMGDSVRDSDRPGVGAATIAFLWRNGRTAAGDRCDRCVVSRTRPGSRLSSPASNVFVQEAAASVGRAGRCESLYGGSSRLGSILVPPRPRPPRPTVSRPRWPFGQSRFGPPSSQALDRRRCRSGSGFRPIDAIAQAGWRCP